MRIEDPSQEWALHSFKLGCDLTDDITFSACDEFMSDGDFIHKRKFQQFMLRNMVDEMQ